MRFRIGVIGLLTFISFTAYAINWDSGFDQGKLPANQITLDTSQFSGNLSSADTNLQLMAETLDQLAAGGGAWGSITGTLSAQTDLNTALGLKAPLASPTFTGVVTAPTYVSTRTVATTTIDWSAGNNRYITLANGANAFTFSVNPTAGTYCKLVLKQPASGAAGTATWSTTVYWNSNIVPTLSPTNRYTDTVVLYYDGTNWTGGLALAGVPTP